MFFIPSCKFNIPSKISSQNTSFRIPFSLSPLVKEKEKRKTLNEVLVYLKISLFCFHFKKIFFVCVIYIFLLKLHWSSNTAFEKFTDILIAQPGMHTLVPFSSPQLLKTLLLSFCVLQFLYEDLVVRVIYLRIYLLAYSFLLQILYAFPKSCLWLVLKKKKKATITSLPAPFPFLVPSFQQTTLQTTSEGKEAHIQVIGGTYKIPGVYTSQGLRDQDISVTIFSDCATPVV